MRIKPCAKFRLLRDGGCWWLELARSESRAWCSGQKKAPLLYELIEAANVLLIDPAGKEIARLRERGGLEGKLFQFMDYGLVTKRSRADEQAMREIWLCGLQWGPIACWWEASREERRPPMPHAREVLQAMNRMLRAARDNDWNVQTHVDVTLR